MTPPRTKSTQRLAWFSRGLLIAVVGLGIGGLLLLRADRRQATRDAETLAQALADSLANKCSGQLRSDLQRYILGVEGARGALTRIAFGAQPDSTNDARVLEEFPAATLDTLPASQVYFMEEYKNFALEIPDAPLPPDWVLRTPTSLLSRWENMEDEALRFGKIPDGVAKFQQDIGKSEFQALQANLQFLFARVDEKRGDAKAERLLGNASFHSNISTPSGVSLSDLAMFRALDEAESPEVVGRLLEHFVSVGYRHPTFLTERLLEKFSARVSQDFPTLTNRIAAARVIWE